MLIYNTQEILQHIRYNLESFSSTNGEFIPSTVTGSPWLHIEVKSGLTSRS